MGKIIFILGGARSGKSAYAVKLAKGLDKKVAFLATCLPLDKEMKERISLHKKKRPAHWQTFEQPKDLTPTLRKICPKFNVIIIDCLTILISNLLGQGLKCAAVENRIAKMLKILKQSKPTSIIVSNEVGLGIVPENALGRRFRDLAGRVNQNVAARANDVFFMVSGLPLKVRKG
ncbi:MAG: bifunctional adenosylcobinamide kinase/adenosylcobinamide-phosphate guanylyltransferase [Candidatus Omnitrophica bacterium]|nr:bifunctional adenosylcobinamide kinase/adenosylcobinamide-phosphate guanylyltransferase [Candidatus Omnitrophota bacterium]